MDAADANDKQVTRSEVSLRARITIDDTSKIGKYTCTAHDEAGNSGSSTFTLQESSGYYPPPVYPGDTSRRKFLKKIRESFLFISYFILKRVVVVKDIYVLLYRNWLKVIMLKFNVKVQHQKMKQILNGILIIEYVFILNIKILEAKNNSS